MIELRGRYNTVKVFTHNIEEKAAEQIHELCSQKIEALAYICPVCFCEIDLFITCEDEPSDQNHGLTLLEAKNNYIRLGRML